MNDSERVKVADVIETELDSYCQSPFNGAFAVSLMQIIDRILADRDAAVTTREADRAVPTVQAVVEPEPGLDALLDSVSPKANMWTAADPTGGYAASIRFPKKDGEWVTIPATGATRMAAIQDAVRQATGAEGSE